MGCVTSKQAVTTITPAFDHSGGLPDNAELGSGHRSRVDSRRGLELDSKKEKHTRNESWVSAGSDSGRKSCKGGSFRLLGNFPKHVEAEQVSAGWPSWLSSVAAEAINGWIPLQAQSFTKLEKIGQGTYSTVFRAWDVKSGKFVALKKVRFDSFEPESVRFMAREITILRRLDHPNVMKLEGVITSRSSYSIYLVFEYMEHDITGLLSRPGVKFSEAQVKCYMKQLLLGIEHCHLMGVMHRDIKGGNLLVNNDGVLKIADFGLANFRNYGRRKQPLTSRVVTLWYRPPELLLGSTDYGTTVDLWSVGCVFSELLTGKPVLRGRTEVEQLHKIFKLCGTPPDDYWKKLKPPHATLFKPHNPYESSLWETFKDLPKAAVFFIETLLSVEPYKRGTASAALVSEYFKSKPYACDPSSLPKYPPSKEFDAKLREEATNVKKKQSGRPCGPDTTRNLTKKQNGVIKFAPEEMIPFLSLHVFAHLFFLFVSYLNQISLQKLVLPDQALCKTNRLCSSKRKEDCVLSLEPTMPSVQRKEEAAHVKNASLGDVPFSGPLQVSGSSGFAWANRRRDHFSVRSNSRSSTRSLAFDLSSTLHPKGNSKSRRNDYTNGHNEHDRSSQDLVKDWSQWDHQDSMDDAYCSQDLSLDMYPKQDMGNRKIALDQEDKIEFSGPLLTQSHKIEELLEKHERQVRQALRRPWFEKVKEQGQ